MNEPIYVTQPSLAPLAEVMPFLEEMWASGVLTHNGPLLQRLEKELAAYLRVPDVVCVANGTCAMQLAIRALDLEGEIITTPFTFVATANIIRWERCKPVFVDIDPETWNLDPGQVEEAITAKTCGLLPVHVFSAPCQVEALDTIAKKHRIRVIYDAAHAMAVQCRSKSVLAYGDVSCLSFHATKLFNTAEGGACVAQDPAIAARIRRLRFFGFDPGKSIVDDGMNAKMTELQAALGLANLRHIDDVRADRRRKYELYVHRLSRLPWLSFQRFEATKYNFSYMPVLFEREDQLNEAVGRLEKERIFPRRYFYPSLHAVRHFRSARKLPVADHVARCILCLPLSSSLSEADIERICHLLESAS